MKVVRNRTVMAEAVKRIPPGAYVSKFYHHDTLTESRSGGDVHVTGARLIMLIALVTQASEGSEVVVSWLKNEVEFKQLVIPAGTTDPVVIDLKAVEAEGDGPSLSMDFAAVTDRLQIEILDAGTNAATLTALGVFDR